MRRAGASTTPTTHDGIVDTTVGVATAGAVVLRIPVTTDAEDPSESARRRRHATALARAPWDERGRIAPRVVSSCGGSLHVIEARVNLQRAP